MSCNVESSWKESCFCWKTGQDMFGNLLKNTLDEVGISSKYLLMDQDIRTTLAFVHTLPDGDREFSFYRNPGADMMLRESESESGTFETNENLPFRNAFYDA